MTKPHDEPTNLNWLTGTTDARKWAEQFFKLHGGDEGLMLAWFTNAIETGRRAGRECLDTKRASHD
jgi:hypothetical protein